MNNETDIMSFCGTDETEEEIDFDSMLHFEEIGEIVSKVENLSDEAFEKFMDMLCDADGISGEDRELSKQQLRGLFRTN